MDFAFRRKSETGSIGSSDDEKKSLSASIAGGTSRFFSSVIAKKNGLFNDLSNKIENTFSPGLSSSSSSSSIEDNESSAIKKSLTAANSKPVGRVKSRVENRSIGEHVTDAQGQGDASASSNSGVGSDRVLINGAQVSFDEPLYPSKSQSSGISTMSKHTDTGSSKPSETETSSVSCSAGSDASSEQTYSSDGKSERTRAPMLTQTKRRSSTVDELLLDEYIEPPVDSPPFNPETAEQENDLVFTTNKMIKNMGDLISFEDKRQQAKTRPSYPSTSSVESSETDPGNAFFPGTSVDSSDTEFGGEQIHRSGSVGSDKSWSSTYSVDSQPDDVTKECMEFMKRFVDKIFKRSMDITQTDKAKLGELCQYAPGRLWFSRYVNSQRVHNKKVSEEIFFQLVQYFAVVLFECNEAEDYSPAKTLMNMCFTFYFETYHSSKNCQKHFLYSFLREQPIWQSLRFWNAAFFDAVQGERARKPVCTSANRDYPIECDKEIYDKWNAAVSENETLSAINRESDNEDLESDGRYHGNITFGQLGTFTCNMRAFGLTKELCLEFLRKQAIIGDLKKAQFRMLKENIDKWHD